MKFVSCIAWIATANTAVAFSGLSSFTGTKTTHHPKSANVATGYRASLLMYENSPDGSSSDSKNNAAANVWSVLAHTEKWISETLASTETDSGNPYSRKEVNYVCETNTDSPMIAANMFKRLREARELGQQHGVTEEDHKINQGEVVL
jgi:hypothetical protein